MPDDLTLVNPGAAHGIKSGHPVYGDLATELVAVEPQPWMRMLAGYVRGANKAVGAIDAEAGGLSPEEVARRVVVAAPRLVAICAFGHQPSASTQTLPSVRAIAQAIRDARSTAKVIVIGGHVSALPERTLAEEPIDFACKGEGAVTICALLNLAWHPDDEPDYASVPGLVWRKRSIVPRSSEIVVNPPAPSVPMERLHGLAWDLLPPANYAAHNWHALGYTDAERHPYASIVTSLNCPYSCSFCCISSPFGGPGYKTRDPVAVVDEIEYLHGEHGVRFIKIVDEMFILKRSHWRPICEEVARRGLTDKINMWAYGRTDSIRNDDLPILRAGGVRWVALGIEAGAEAVRAGANKSQRDNAGITRLVDIIRDNDMSVIANYIFGLPDDNLESMQQTFDLAQELNTEWANFYVCQAYPGSALYTQALAEGWTLPETWAGYSQHNRHTRPLDTKHVSAAKVLCFRDAAFVTYFSSPRYRTMLGVKFGPAAVAHVEEMLRYGLERDLLKPAVNQH